jgi:hypothetical protein
MKLLPPVPSKSPTTLTAEQREILAQLALVYTAMSSRRTPEFAVRKMQETFGISFTEEELYDVQRRLAPEVLRALADAIRGKS